MTEKKSRRKMLQSDLVFDTAALLSENFPELSSSFRQLTEIAQSLDFNLYIPEIVLKELEERFMENTENAIHKMMNEHRKLKNIVQERFSLSVPEIGDIRKAYQDDVQKLITRNKLIIIPMPSIKAEELIDRAVKRVPPFEREDKGFRDAMIIESIIEHGTKERISHFVFVSFDKIFEDNAVSTYARSKGVELHIEKRIADVNENVFKLLDDVRQEAIKERERRGISFLTIKKAEINEFLKNNFETDEYDIGNLPGTPLNMIGVKLASIESAAIEDKEDKKRGISFEGKVEVTMLVRSLGLELAPKPAKRFKMGDTDSSEAGTHTLYDLFSFPSTGSFGKTIRVKKTLEVKGEVEIELDGEEYVNLRIIYIRPRPPHFGALLGMNYSQGWDIEDISS
jgi:PIN domain